MCSQYIGIGTDPQYVELRDTATYCILELFEELGSNFDALRARAQKIPEELPHNAMRLVTL